MKPPPFDYVAPTTTASVAEVLSSHGEGARIIAGGQSLIPLLRARLVAPDVVVDLRRVEGAISITSSDQAVTFGAMVTHRQAAQWAAANAESLLVDAARDIGHPTILTMGTVVGSLAFADPSAEWAAVAMVLDASCRVVGPNGHRSLQASELFMAPHLTSLKAGEFIEAVTFPLLPPGSGAAFAEVSTRSGEPAVAGAAVVLSFNAERRIQSARVSLVGLGPVPLDGRTVEQGLIGLKAGSDVKSVAALVANDIEPVGDLRGSEGYRRSIAPVVVERALHHATQRGIDAT